MSERDAPAGEIVWGEFHHYAISWKHTNVVLAHATTEVTEHFVSVLEFHSELGVWQGFLHDTVHGDCIGISATWS